jgi:DNA-binding CsgD family transcriptional regulator
MMRTGSSGGDRTPRVAAARRTATAVSPIRGRIDEIGLIDALITRLSRGEGAVLVLEGPPGIGKSRLLQELGIRSTRAGAQQLTGRAFEDQQTVPFGPLLSATTTATPPVGDSDALKKLGEAGDLGFWMIHELQNAISSAAKTRPLLITIDDIHWADAGTLVSLRTLVPGLAEGPVLWALATRPAESRPAVLETLEAISTLIRPHAHRVRVGALSDEAVAEITADVLSAEADDALLGLTQRAHGNPYLVLELMRGLREEDRIRVEEFRASPIGLHLPHRLTDNMNQRLERLSEGARNIVQVASILPPRFTAALLASMLGQTPAQLLASVAEAIHADLLAEDRDHFKFRHDLLRQAARQAIPYSLRRALERESARILLQHGAGPVEVAAQLSRSAEIGDAEAVTALRQAAESLGASDPSGAADLSLRAVELLRSDDAERPAIVAETVQRLNRASRWDEVQQLGTLAVTSGVSDIPGEEEALIRLVLSMVNDGSNNARIEHNRRALELDGVSAVTRARHLGHLAHNLVFIGNAQLAYEAALTAMDAGEAADDPYTKLMADMTLALVDCSTGRGRRCLERVYGLLAQAQQADEKVASLAILHGANLLMTLGQIDEGNGLCDMAISAAQDAHYDEAAHIYTHLRAVGEFAAGRLAEARPIVDSVPDGQRFGTENLNSLVGSVTLAALAAHTEDLPLQWIISSAVRPGLVESLAEQRAAIGALAHMAWQRGDSDEAARWLSSELDLLGTPLSPVHLDQLVIAARLVAISGDAGLRERVLTAARTLETEDEPLPLFAGIAMQARGLLDHDIDALMSAAGILSDTARPLLSAGAAEDLGRLMSRQGREDDAVQHLTTAFETFVRCGSTADARRVSASLQQLGVTRRVVRSRHETGWESLTAAERRVFDLVAAGASNREVAEELSVSANTVSTHLRKVFTKLGVHSRMALIDLAKARE